MFLNERAPLTWYKNSVLPWVFSNDRGDLDLSVYSFSSTDCSLKQCWRPHNDRSTKVKISPGSWNSPLTYSNKFMLIRTIFKGVIILRSWGNNGLNEHNRSSLAVIISYVSWFDAPILFVRVVHSALCRELLINKTECISVWIYRASKWASKQGTDNNSELSRYSPAHNLRSASPTTLKFVQTPFLSLGFNIWKNEGNLRPWNFE